MGPIGVKAHLAKYLPGHPIVPLNGQKDGAVSGAPWGSSSILPITWAYIRLMGASGLKMASQVAILNANYMAKCLEEGGFKVVYKDEQGLIAHEFIIDFRCFKSRVGIDVIDIAKRLMDYGFHAPTVHWPLHDCIMIEPTESEDKPEMDRYIESLISIRQEINEVEAGQLSKDIFKLAPHTLSVCSSDWKRAYPRERAGWPKPWCYTPRKVWPSVGRIDDSYGDRNLFCNCPSLN